MPPQDDGGSHDVSVTVFKTGKSDSVLIQSDDKAMLIDTATSDNAQKVISELEKYGVTELEYLVITHLDRDHVGGASQILSALKVNRVFQSRNVTDSDEYADFSAECQRLGLKPEKPSHVKRLAIGNCALTLMPSKLAYYSDDNDYSLMARIECGETSFLFAGDAEDVRLAEYLESNGGHADFLKIPHHGRECEKSGQFLSAVNPEYAVITCSKKNPPDKAVCDMLDSLNCKTFLTSDGTVFAVSDGKSINVIQ